MAADRDPSAQGQTARLQTILDVARAMVENRRLEPLLELVVAEAAKVVAADRCSLFLVDRERGELWSKVAQGADEIRIPLGTGIAGTVAVTGETINLADAYAEPSFNPGVDASTGYRTRNLLAVPMRSTKGEVVGVIEVLNRIDGSFTAEDEETLTILAGQAATAVENAVLHEEIERLFESFVRASVIAIEARDPDTAGHSERVARLSVALARALDRVRPEPYSDIHFGPHEIRQLRFAAILHDFGKVGVREQVLLKANKLYPHELDRISQRFDLIRASMEVERLHARLEGRTTESIDRRREELEHFWNLIRSANRPTVLAEDVCHELASLIGLSFVDPRGARHPYLTEEELSHLSIRRGSLSPAERLEIESHVIHTFRFLSEIPWSRSLGRVPDIAHGHHERLDGKGYPRGAAGDAIPVESRIMAIADLFDAITAADRPYKKAVPLETALGIIRDEVDAGRIDGVLFGVFVDEEVYSEVLSSPGPSV